MNTPTETTTTTREGTDRAGTPSFARPSQDIEVTDLGKTTISDDVVTTIAHLAAAHVPGVYRLGGTGIRGAFSRLSRTNGVESEVGQRQTAITLDVVIEFGYQLADIAHALRERVIEAVEHMADRQVVAVDINIVDIHVAKRDTTSRALE